MSESALDQLSVEYHDLQIVLVLPSNKAVLTAVAGCGCAAAVSETVAAPWVESGRLAIVDIARPTRRFSLLRHKERRLSAAARQIKALCPSI